MLTSSTGEPVDEVGGGGVAAAFLFGDAGDDFGRIMTHLGTGLVDGDDVAGIAKSAIVRIDDIFGKRRDAALPRRIRT